MSDEIRRWGMWLEWFVDWRELEAAYWGIGARPTLELEDMSWGDHGELGEAGA